MKKMIRIIKAAFKGLGKNKLRSFLMMIGIVIGIAAVTSIISVGLGSKMRIMERVKKFGLDSMMVFSGGGKQIGQPSGGKPVTTLKLSDAETIKNMIDEIKEVAPFQRRREGRVKYEGETITTRLFGITPTWDPVWDWGVSEGEFFTSEDMERLQRVCIIAPTARQALFGDSNPIGKQILVGNVPFQVKGIMKGKGISPGGGDMDDRVYVPLSTFMRRVANIDYLGGIKIRLKDRKDIEKVETQIKTILRERHTLAEGEPDDFSITVPTEVTDVAERVAGTFNIFLS